MAPRSVGARKAESRVFMRPRMLKLAYRLRYHYWGYWSLEGWLTGLALAGAALALARRLPEYLAGGSPALWALPILLVALALLLKLYARWAAAAAYLIFRPEPLVTAPAPHALLPADKVLIRASGRFEVQGKSHFFAGLLAYWRTFASREHAVMAIVHPSRFLLFGTMPERDLGLWYIFFCPDKMLALRPGRITFGREQQLALQVTYQPPRPPSPPSRRRNARPRPRPLPSPETVYLIFDDEAGRAHVWADLLADGDVALA